MCYSLFFSTSAGVIFVSFVQAPQNTVQKFYMQKSFIDQNAPATLK
jgi:hypothetical protein